MTPFKTSTTLAAAAAIFALASTAGAQQTAQSTAPGASAEIVHCYGVNSCKGTSDCKSYNHDCKGKNDCKGQGFKAESKGQCAADGGKLSE